MTGPSSTMRRGHGRFSCPYGSDTEEDRGSDGGNGSKGNNGTPDNCRNGEERNNRSALPATAVNPLDSAKRVYPRQREEGGWRNDVMATNDDGNNSGNVEEWRWTGEGRLLTRPRGQSTRPPVIAYQHCCTGSG